MTDHTDPVTFTSPRRRMLHVYGEPGLLTMDRLAEFGRRIDSDARLVSLSLVASPLVTDTWVRAAAPAGALVALAGDAQDLVGPLPPPEASADMLTAWARAASERGLWHDWWLTQDRDAARAEIIVEPSDIDHVESDDPSGSHFALTHTQPRKSTGISVAVDVTWLGPYETGAQVLTTAAVQALAADDRIASITLIGLDELPGYAAHLIDHPKIHIANASERESHGELADIVWYPNQIDGRSSIANARRLGRRVVTTYLDLIAYDIPRYHASAEAWAAYRSLQRRIALSVDGVTTISADVAARLRQEVPRLESERVSAIALGLDHITGATAPQRPDADLADVVAAMQGTSGDRRRFIAVLGNDFRHKNRDFAIAVWQQVLQQGVSCDLVLAGLHVRSSSSKDAEGALLSTHVDLRGRVHVVGHLSSASRAWLLANAAAVLYPTSAEGFGFVPYEAAVLGTPCSFADFGPLHEIAQLDGLPSRWSIDDFASDVRQLLESPDAAALRIAGLDAAIREYTWRRFADHLIDFFQRVIAVPTVSTSTVSDTSGSDAMLASIMQSRSWRATQRLQRVRQRMRLRK